MDKLSSWLFWINVGNSFAVRFTFNEAFYTESQIWRQIGDKIDTQILWPWKYFFASKIVLRQPSP